MGKRSKRIAAKRIAATRLANQNSYASRDNALEASALKVPLSHARPPLARAIIFVIIITHTLSRARELSLSPSLSLSLTPL